MKGYFPVEEKKFGFKTKFTVVSRPGTSLNFVLNPNFFQTGTNLSLKVQSRMEDKVRIKNLKSLFDFFEKFGRGAKQRELKRDGNFFPKSIISIKGFVHLFLPFRGGLRVTTCGGKTSDSFSFSSSFINQDEKKSLIFS